MFDDFKICPYTGLRPFSEEESLYFKGRDENIEQATRQLEKNKFLILTGASGDGKSSLIFGGVIPNARSGFLKSRFSNWSVADFRPERTPFKNLCSSIAHQLGISNIETVEAELSRGFSALTDLYKSSSLYYDESDDSWQQADQDGKLKIKRKASNLIILADQFEEFFTNPENYSKGIPSQEAALVTNLLLETARIALEENLPIYVVITMRSDFIGQCAAFRGLPEYIGFSQFFVPRLNRKQLQEVIEEPALLSGNTISRRLTERLIEDLTEGADQLPILQHALTQIWKKASEKDEEMDLVHYAMVGGMNHKELPEEEGLRFSRWFNDLPSKIRECYDKPGLQNVLNTHANIITNQVVEYVREKSGDVISDEEGKAVIKTTFKCLTKINQGRAVRNRMTLREITQILDQSQLDTNRVAHILNIFRDQDNTLLKPFVTEVPALEDDTVLDITHESLIRNWRHLGEWADEEFDNYSIFLDFRQQLERWVDNDKSADFLLSIGPLTYFENWFDKAKPNQYWIARYEGDHGAHDDKLNRSRDLQKNAKEFLKRSSRKHFVTRTVMRYGPKKIALVLGAIIFLTASSFMISNYVQQQNSVVRNFLVEESLRYSNAPGVQQAQKVAAIDQQLRIGDITAKRVLANARNYKDKINLAIQVPVWSVINAASANDKDILDFFDATDSILHQAVTTLSAQTELEFILKKNNDFIALMEYANHYTKNDTLKTLLQRSAQRAAVLVKYIIQNKPTSFNEPRDLNDAIEHVLNYKAFSSEDMAVVLKELSPFEQTADSSDSWINKHYARSKLYITGNQNNGFAFGGLYQELSYFYAALGDQYHVQQCMDSILLYNEHYPDRKYVENTDNAFNIAYYFFHYNQLDKLDDFVNYYILKAPTSADDFYARLLSRSDVYFISANKLDAQFSPSPNKNHNTNLEFSNPQMISFFSEKLRHAISTSSYSPAVKNYKLALAYKNEGILISKRLLDANQEYINDDINKLYEQAFLAYDRVDPAYLNEIISSVASFQVVDVNVPRKYFFAYPDFRVPYTPYQGGYFSYKSPSFIRYVITNGRFSSLYKTSQHLSWIEEWLSAENHQTIFPGLNGKKLDYDLLIKLESLLSESQEASLLDFNLLYLNLGNQADNQGDEKRAKEFYHKVDPAKIKKYLFGQAQGGIFYYQDCEVLRKVSLAVSDLTKYKDFEWAYALTRSFENPINRSSVYAFAARSLIFLDRIKGPLVDQLIDSSYQEMNRVHNVDDQPNRVTLAGALALRNGPDDIEEAFRVIKNVRFKQIGIWMICRGLAFNDEFYKAYKTIPENLGDDDIMGYFFEIYEYCRGDENQSPFWNKVEVNRFIGNERLDYIP